LSKLLAVFNFGQSVATNLGENVHVCTPHTAGLGGPACGRDNGGRESCGFPVADGLTDALG
jgi:hypothetical protein